MSDPYAGTVTVRNILQHVLSPKIVADQTGGYRTVVDIVNVDTVNAGRLVASSAQCGSVFGDGGSPQISVPATGLTATSIVLATTALVGGPAVESVGIDLPNNCFIIRCAANIPTNCRIGWFIAKF